MRIMPKRLAANRHRLTPALLTLLCAAGQVTAQVSTCPDQGVHFVPPRAMPTGIALSCSSMNLMIHGVSVNVPGTRCMSLVCLIPGHYEPCPRPGWQLTEPEAVPIQVFPHHCDESFFLFILLSSSCRVDPPYENGYVTSWHALPCPASAAPSPPGGQGPAGR